MPSWRVSIVEQIYFRDREGRKWCHVVAMDAIYFRDRTEQYKMKFVERELLKAYVSFHPQGGGSDYHSGIATGNWGCGAFNGDRELKGIFVDIRTFEY